MLLEELNKLFEDIPEPISKEQTVGGLVCSGKALFVSKMIIKYPEYVHLYVTQREDIAKTLIQDIQFYLSLLGHSQIDILYLPEGQNIEEIGQRITTLINAEYGKVIVGTEKAFMRPTWSVEKLHKLILHLKEGETIQRSSFIEALQRLGYKRTTLVKQRGEFMDHHWVFDLWPVDTDSPVRIEFFGDEIDKIKRIDLETQRSTDSVKELYVFPAFESQQEQCFNNLSNTIWYIDESASKPVRTPKAIFRLSSLKLQGAYQYPISPLSGLGLSYKERNSFEQMVQKIKLLIREGYRIVFVVLTEAQAVRLKETFREFDMIVTVVPVEALKHHPAPIAITYGRVSSGLKLQKLLLISSNDMFGPVPIVKKSRSLKKLLAALDDLKPGDYVVHQDYGIGLFRGLTKLTTQAGTTEALVLEYKNSARLYVPTYNIGLIEKYRAEEGVIPQLDPLDSKAWKRKKERLRKKIQEMAYKLLNLYARREIIRGHAFTPETALHREFEDFFPYEPTEDQIKAWEEIKQDMESPKPMDRLLAGDVGFGKTELAMRAAFKAVFDRKQVAVVVPTTILCEQHYLNFKERFNPFGITVDYLSRFKTKKEIAQTLKALQEGRVDIIIGTHLLFSPQVKFKDLGLLIIDEEHRFGVVHKEKLKEMKKEIDCLSLSATPIPRTLEMALSGLRAISVLEIPPQDRLAVKGIITEYKPEVIKKAIFMEVQRGGQVFFVHNRIQDIHLWKEKIQALVPSLKIGLAHGRMKEKELEKVMLQFMKGEYDILVCTNIIGSGIDIPTVNTIIINDAHKMGLADLYQLKGRVGRTNLQAYAYFIVPPITSLSEEARRRITAIEELNYLGAGLHLAMKDLEIRGAGNLLGKQQSGHIHALGFDLYMRMLREEIELLQGKIHEEIPEPEIQIKLNAYIPDDYIYDITQKVNIYRRFYQAESEEEIEQLLEELKDRFGPPPIEVITYAELMKLKHIAKTLAIKAIVFLKDRVKVHFYKQELIDPNRVLELLKEQQPRFFEEGFSFKFSNEPLRTTKEVLKKLNTITAAIHALQ